MRRGPALMKAHMELCMKQSSQDSVQRKPSLGSADRGYLRQSQSAPSESLRSESCPATGSTSKRTTLPMSGRVVYEVDGRAPYSRGLVFDRAIAPNAVCGRTLSGADSLRAGEQFSIHRGRDVR